MTKNFSYSAMFALFWKYINNCKHVDLLKVWNLTDLSVVGNNETVFVDGVNPSAPRTTSLLHEYVIVHRSSLREQVLL